MNTRPTLFLVVFGLVWSPLTLLFDGFIFGSAARQLRAAGYATTEGTILSSQVTHNTDSDGGPTYGVAVSYKYFVGDREFTSERYRYGSASTSDSGWARALVAKWSPGSTVRVFYNPAKPSEAVLQTGLGGSDLFLFAFITPFNAVMLGFWWAGLARLRRAWFKPVAGGARIIVTPRDTRVRLTPFSPMAVGIASLGLAAFLTIFVVAFAAGGFHPSENTMIVAWSLIFTAGVAGGGWQAGKVLSGKYDLILDELNHTLELPLTRGRKERRSVPWSAIRDIRVETVLKPANRGGQSSPAYVPTLGFQQGGSQSEGLVEWYSEVKAQEFAAWLREKLQGESTPSDRT